MFLYWTSNRFCDILSIEILTHTENIMPNIIEMTPTEFRELLHTPVNTEMVTLHLW